MGGSTKRRPREKLGGHSDGAGGYRSGQGMWEEQDESSLRLAGGLAVPGGSWAVAVVRAVLGAWTERGGVGRVGRWKSEAPGLGAGGGSEDIGGQG